MSISYWLGKKKERRDFLFRNSTTPNSNSGWFQEHKLVVLLRLMQLSCICVFFFFTILNKDILLYIYIYTHTFFKINFLK